MEIVQNGRVVFEHPSDIFFRTKDVTNDDDIVTFINTVEALTYKDLVDKVNKKGYYGRTPIILPQIYQDRFVVQNFDLSDIKDYKSTKHYKDLLDNGYPNPYLQNALHPAKFDHYQKYEAFSIINKTHHDLIEVDILSGRKELIKQSIETRSGQLLFNFAELDYSERIECNEEAYRKKVGNKTFSVPMINILNEDKFLYIPTLGKIYYSDSIKDDVIVDDLICRIQESMGINFSHDATMDCKFAISCQDSYGFVDKLYAIVDDEIVDINIYNATGINTLFDNLVTNDENIERDIEVVKDITKNENSNIWITKMVLDKETGKSDHSQKLHHMTLDMYMSDTFIIDNIVFSSSYETLKKYRKKCMKNTHKFSDEFTKLDKEFKKLRKEYDKEVIENKNFKTLHEAYENLEKRNNFLSKFVNYIDSKSPEVYTQIKDQFLISVHETEDKETIKKNLKVLENIVEKDRDALKHQHEMELKEIKKDIDLQQYQHKRDLGDRDSQHKISLRNFDYKLKNAEVRSKEVTTKFDFLKNLGAFVKSIVPMIMGGLALLFGIGPMKV